MEEFSSKIDYENMNYGVFKNEHVYEYSSRSQNIQNDSY